MNDVNFPSFQLTGHWGSRKMKETEDSEKKEFHWVKWIALWEIGCKIKGMKKEVLVLYWICHVSEEESKK